MRIQAPTLGPIVGGTTTNFARVWARGDAHMQGGQPRRCYGVARWRERGEASWGLARHFKMNPNFDMTGILVVTELEASTDYDYQVGVVYADVDPHPAVVAEADWSDAVGGTFRTASADKDDPRTIVFGSCRYLMRIFGGSLWDDRGDKTFKSIRAQIAQGTHVDQLIMLGDQIYADDLNAVRPDEHLDQFYARYRDAFSQEHIRALMANVPTYMTLDDHEIEDNWPAKATSKDWLTKYPVAMHAYLTYQASHSPLFSVHGGRIRGIPDRLWYRYQDGCCDTFVLDARTERDASIGQMIGDEQMAALKEFLQHDNGLVKIVVSSVPFFPDAKRAEGEDKWAGFARQRDEILACVGTRRLGRVVFFSGDVHSSMSAEIHSRNWPGTKIISVVSSAFFWPYPHAKRRSFDFTTPIDGATSGRWTVENASDVWATDNFVRVRIDPGAGLKVEVYGRKGDKKGEHQHSFS